MRKFFEHPAFTTDVIVGFPGESEEEFQETLEFVKGIGFSQIHVFKYSKRAGTVAAKMPNQIPEDIKHQRSNELITLVERMAKEYKDYFMGRIEKILIEEEINLGGKTYQIGHNERYLKLAVECDEDLTNRVIEAKVCNNLTDEILLCEIIH